jgi:hypothetical protein
MTRGLVPASVVGCSSEGTKTAFPARAISEGEGAGECAQKEEVWRFEFRDHPEPSEGSKVSAARGWGWGMEARPPRSRCRDHRATRQSWRFKIQDQTKKGSKGSSARG